MAEHNPLETSLLEATKARDYLRSRKGEAEGDIMSGIAFSTISAVSALGAYHQYKGIPGFIYGAISGISGYKGIINLADGILSRRGIIRDLRKAELRVKQCQEKQI